MIYLCTLFGRLFDYNNISNIDKMHLLEKKRLNSTEFFKINHLQFFLIIVSLMLLCSVNSFGQKLAVKSNLPYLATGTSNVALEFGLSPKLTLDLSYGLNPFTFDNNTKWKHWLIQPEMRYWFCERFYGHFLGLHVGMSEYNLGGINIPTVKNSSDFRYEGWAAMGGLSYGYSWVLGGRWNLEASLGVGMIYTDYKKFDCPECGKLLEEENKIFVAPTKAAISIIYLLK